MSWFGNPHKLVSLPKYNDTPSAVGPMSTSPTRYRVETPAMTVQDDTGIIAFLKTLTDGYQPKLGGS